MYRLSAITQNQKSLNYVQALFRIRKSRQIIKIKKNRGYKSTPNPNKYRPFFLRSKTGVQ